MNDCKDMECITIEETSVVNRLEDVGSKTKIIYVTDPMCSWCYGISPVLEGLQNYCHEHNIALEVVVGGLRSGGKGTWTPEFKGFLKETWTRISKVTGLPFSDDLLSHEYFNYDTTPSCDAIVLAKELLSKENKQNIIPFLIELQRKFYQEGQDPKEAQFYQSVCEKTGVDYEAFKSLFNNPKTRSLTKSEFEWCRQVGVSGFPSFLLIYDSKVHLLASGYTSLEKILERLTALESLAV